MNPIFSIFWHLYAEKLDRRSLYFFDRCFSSAYHVTTVFV
ncbi:hypothetical protein CKA32_002011 [Geitlerinema sp. FC II]|nr:hypothetical protein CKA32_002011 [Geitlerinema sp. FC II]